VANILHLPEDDLNELNLQKLHSRAPNFTKKQEVKKVVGYQVKKAIEEGELLVLNIDDTQGPGQDSQVSLRSGQDTTEISYGYDGNLKTFYGTIGFPMDLWTPSEFGKRKEQLEMMGLSSPEEEFSPDLQEQVNFVVWTKFLFKGKDYWGLQMKSLEE